MTEFAKPNIRSIDMLVIDDLFEMGSGYVLNFSDRTFAQFFNEELGIDIDDPKYATHGTSKAKRMRCFLQTVDKGTVKRALNALWEYREIMRQRAGSKEPLKDAMESLQRIISRLDMGEMIQPRVEVSSEPEFDRTVYPRLLTGLQDLSGLEPHPRGYAFEAFLRTTFDTFGLEARDAFRLRGEQIDGSFVLGNEIYLLEAKWQNTKSGIGDLHTFHGKVEQKAAWTRGLFISFSGFTEDGLHAFGRGKRVICMDGYDLSEAFVQELPLSRVLELKIRRAAETGLAFVRLRDLVAA